MVKMTVIQGVPRLIADVDFELQTTVKDNSVFLFVFWRSTFRIFSDQNQAFLTTGHLTESKSVQVVILKWSGKNRDKLQKVNV